MASGTRLPSGFIVLLLTPREAVFVADELLDPDDFPWQNSEGQITGLEVKKILREMIHEDAQKELSQTRTPDPEPTLGSLAGSGSVSS